VTGVFASQSDAQHAMAEMRLAGAHHDRITLFAAKNTIKHLGRWTPRWEELEKHVSRSREQRS